MLKSKSSSKEKVSVILFFIILLQSQITSVYCQNNNQFESTKGSQTRNEPRNGENNLTYFSRIKRNKLRTGRNGIILQIILILILGYFQRMLLVRTV